VSENPLLTTTGHPEWAAIDADRIASEREALQLPMSDRLLAGVQLSEHAMAWFDACRASIGHGPDART